MYSESISKIKWEDVLDADIICIGIFTFSANRGYELTQYIKDKFKRKGSFIRTACVYELYRGG